MVSDGTYSTMKILLRLLAIILLILAALLTIARRQNSDAWIVFVADTVFRGRLIMMMPEDGRIVRPLAPQYPCAHSPQWSPDGNWVTFSDNCMEVPQTIRIRPDGSNLQAIAGQDRYDVAHWSPDSQVLALTREDFIAREHKYFLTLVNADGSGERLLAEDHRVIEWSPDGAWIYATPVPNDTNSIVRIHVQTGRIEPIIRGLGNITKPTWSPDAEQMALVKRSGDDYSLITMRPDGSQIQTIVKSLASRHVAEAQWSPDGEWIAFAMAESPNYYNIYRVRADGSDLQQISERLYTIWDLQWSSDSQWLLFTTYVNDAPGIYRLRADGSQLENLTPALGNAYSPHYGHFPGKDWHPFWLMTAAMGIIGLSMVERFRR
jgi:Tol biopolymer transport system component